MAHVDEAGAPPPIEAEIAENNDVVMLADDDALIIEPEERQEAPAGVATEAALDGVEAVIDHTGEMTESASDEVTIEGDNEVAELDDSCTLPMYDEPSTGEDPPTELCALEVVEVLADNQDLKNDSLTVEGLSQTIVEASEVGDQPIRNLPATFLHCYICGFDRETIFMKEKKANSGQFRNRVIYRNRCVRKNCIRFFGPSYIWDGKAGEYVKISEESGTALRPYTNGPREEKYPAIDYERAGESGVKPPLENNGGWLRAAKTFRTITDPTDIPSTSSSVPLLSSLKAPATCAKMTISGATSKKTRKGYQWVEEEDVPAVPRVDPVIQLARMYAAQSKAEDAILTGALTRSDMGTQTGEEDHLVQLLVEEMRAKAIFRGLPVNEEVPMSAAVSNRLFLAQQTIRTMTKEIKSLRSDNAFLRDRVGKFNGLLVAYKKDLVSDTTRLKEDVQVANRELKNFSLEMQNEASKDIKDIKKIKEQLAARIDDADRYTKKVEASLEHQKSLTKEAEHLADNYHRIGVNLEKSIIMAKVEEEDAKAKLNDKIYLTNNSKCGHCQVNERIKNMLTEQIADKTLSATNLGKERAELAKKLENSERIVSIVSKENKKLKFEKSAWESNCHRFRAELLQLKGNNSGLVLPSLLPSTAPGEAAFTPQSTTTKDDKEDVSPERVDEIIEVDRPQPTSSSSSAEEGEYKSPSSMSPASLARLPPPPAPPAAQLKEPSPEHAPEFANWIPKDRKAQEMPSEMAEAMQKVAEALERGPVLKKDEKGGPSTKKENRDDKAGNKRSGAPPHSSGSHYHKNGEKKPKLEGGLVKNKKVPSSPTPPTRSIPTLGSSQKAKDSTSSPIMSRNEKETKKESVPYSSAHEPAYPAVVTKKPVTMVPYNGPSSLVAGVTPTSTSTASKSHPSTLPQKTQQSQKQQRPLQQNGTPEKKPLSFLPVAGSSAMPPLTIPPRDPAALPMDGIIREAERLRILEIERAKRAAAMHRTHMPTSGGSSRFGDEELPWNQGRPRAVAAAPNYNQHQPMRPRTPVQDWFYNTPGNAPTAQQPREPSPSRYYDDMYNPHAPRDQYGRLEPDFSGMRRPQHHPGTGHQGQPGYPLGPPHQGPPLPLSRPPHDGAWRREWHEPSWSDQQPPPRRGYWD